MGSRDEATLRRIYRRTDGRCHICAGNLTFSSYAKEGASGAWEVEHSVPRSRGGSDSLNNLYAAHITCNGQKGDGSTRDARALHGRTRAPLSREAASRALVERSIFGAGLGGLGALALLGPAAVVPLAVMGGLAGALTTPK